MSHLIYSNTALVTADGETAFNGHTDAVYVYNAGGTVVDVRLNGRYDVAIPPNTIGYTVIPGDYTKIEVVTAASTVSVYAIG